MKMFKGLLAVASVAICMSTAVYAELPHVSEARMVQPPPGADVAAAFFTISNRGTEPLFITGAQSDIAEQTEVQLSFVEDDVAKMEQQASVEIPAGESLDFKHGSYHIMFMGLNEAPQAGDDLDLILDTSAGDINILVPVISLDEAMSKNHPQQDHTHEMDADESMQDQ